MTSDLKRLVISFLAFVWCFLCGVCCLEAADHFQDTHDDQAIEQLLATPLEKTVTADHGRPIISLIFSIQNFPFDGPRSKPAFITRSEFSPNESPPGKIFKLYQQYCNYRI